MPLSYHRPGFMLGDTGHEKGLQELTWPLKATQSCRHWQCSLCHDSIIPYVVLWRSGSTVARWSRSTKLTYVGPGEYWDAWPCSGSVPGAGHLSWYVISHPGQLSLVIPLRVGAMSISQRAMTHCGCGVKAGMVSVWVAGKTMWSRCYTRAVSERFRDGTL